MDLITETFQPLKDRERVNEHYSGIVTGLVDKLFFSGPSKNHRTCCSLKFAIYLQR